MTIMTDIRVKYHHIWYKVEAVDKNGYIEAYREDNMKKVYSEEIKQGLFKQIRG